MFIGLGWDGKAPGRIRPLLLDLRRWMDGRMDRRMVPNTPVMGLLSGAEPLLRAMGRQLGAALCMALHRQSQTPWPEVWGTSRPHPMVCPTDDLSPLTQRGNEFAEAQPQPLQCPRSRASLGASLRAGRPWPEAASAR